MPITTEDILTSRRRMAEVIEENKKYFTKSDCPIGDADRGVNMNRGFQTVLKRLPSAEDKDAGTILKATSIALVSSAGGADGPLCGTAFTQAGMAVVGKFELESEDVLDALRLALDGVVMRGKTNPVDKTMVNAITPSVDAMEESLD